MQLRQQTRCLSTATGTEADEPLGGARSRRICAETPAAALLTAADRARRRDLATTSRSNVTRGYRVSGAAVASEARCGIEFWPPFLAYRFFRYPGCSYRNCVYQLWPVINH
jgi:hypothetical protein